MKKIDSYASRRRLERVPLTGEEPGDIRLTTPVELLTKVTVGFKTD